MSRWGETDLCLRSFVDFDFMLGDIAEVVRDSRAHLDIGCSTGALLQIVAKLSPGIRLTGCDVSRARLAEAGALCPDARLDEVDANKPLPYGAGEFDSITCFEVLEHLDAPGILLKEMWRTLRPGGLVLMTTPNADALMRRLRPSNWYALNDPSHLIFFTPYVLSFSLGRVGFTLKRMWTNSLTGSKIYDAVLSRLSLGGQLCVLARKEFK